MTKIIIICVTAFVMLAMWKIGSALSSDAISMAVGVLFGVLATVPPALLSIASERRRNEFRQNEPQQFTVVEPSESTAYKRYILAEYGRLHLDAQRQAYRVISVE